uniref:B box-type domain-containing protein n=1 Tax=Cyprinus carpio carpio TaxID=630221 RepID=A0A9J8AFU1_CYPCA
MFSPKSVPRSSVRVDDLLERMKKVKLPSSNHPSDQTYAGPGEVQCDECTGRKHKAVKSCLMCLASFCESHLIAHTTMPYLKRHKLIEASPDLQENICSQHDKLNEFYCLTDQKCICALCVLNEHKEHDTAEVETERMGKQTEIAEKRREVKQRIKEKQKELDELKQSLDTLKIIISLHWTSVLHMMNSEFLKTTEKQCAVRQSDRIFSIRTDLIFGPRCYAKKV